mgnify:CR=1 FL=1
MIIFMMKMMTILIMKTILMTSLLNQFTLTQRNPSVSQDAITTLVENSISAEVKNENKKLQNNNKVLQAEYKKALAEKAPITICAGKAIIAEILKASPEVDHDQCRQLIRDCFESEDYSEGRRAFMEKRKPIFRGK